MRSLRRRIVFWFGVSFALLAAVLVLLAENLFDAELRGKNWCQIFPNHPDWVLHGSYSEDEVKNLTRNLTAAMFIGSLPVVAASLAVGYWLARKSLRPIASVNEQLQEKTTANLGQPIQLPEMDAEFNALLRHLNDLLSRLNHSFTEMNEYAAKVSHELRTPLAIVRLKLEQADGQIRPDLAEELHSELQRLTYVVDQSLLIARADQGRVLANPTRFDLAAVVADVVQDFQILATDEHRSLVLKSPATCFVKSDEAHARQIVHNLLTNSLKHGEGDLHVRVSCKNHGVSLLIANRVAPKRSVNKATLGIGLRVVSALLRLEPSIRFRQRQNRRYYLVRLVFPVSKAPSPASLGGQESSDGSTSLDSARI